MRLRSWTYLLICLLLFCRVGTVFAQSLADSAGDVPRDGVLKSKVDSLRLSMASRRSVSVSALSTVADSLRRTYNFAASVKLYEQALREVSDSSELAGIENALTLSRNGLNMMAYCTKPRVISKRRFSIGDFFLYYPMQDGSWRSKPNCLDSLGRHPLVCADYVPSDAVQFFYSSAGADSVMNIYYTEYQDTAWTAPRLINEGLTTASDEIFPVLNHDGQSLYFASAGLYGMGGYDLYVSHWNPRLHDWDTPTNLGFPYSSPYDDFLYYNTPDGRFTLFASNRECSRDSVYVYVLEFDTLPVRSAVTEASELQHLSLLEPETLDIQRTPRKEEPVTEDVRVYLDQMNEVRSLRDSLNHISSQLDAMRAEFSSASDVRKAELSSEILQKELSIMSVQRTLEGASRRLQVTEMEFLDKGAVITPNNYTETTPTLNVPTIVEYEFMRHHWGDSLQMKFLSPVMEESGE